MSGRSDNDGRGVIAGQYAVDISRPMPDAGGGVTAFAVNGRSGTGSPLMALLIDRNAPMRARPLQSLIAGMEGVLTPVAHGVGPPLDGKPAYYLICTAPSGPSLATGLGPWAEHVLMEQVLRPIALVLDQLHARGMTHRAIRANNVFLAQPNRPVVLGAAWSEPPAMRQPAIYETAYTAICHPAGRGDGRTADDVYALGVLLLTLALGHTPMQGADEQTIIYRKQEVGDFMALAGTERLPPMLADLVRGMLAEDPDHRPPPSLLRDPAGARGRRVAARPASRAQRSFNLGTHTAWNSRTLALAMAWAPDETHTAIETGTLMYWLRRGLGDSSLAVKLEELVRQKAQDLSTDRGTASAMLVMRAIVDIDINMPLCWRGLLLYPDALGGVLASNPDNDPETQQKSLEIVMSEAQAAWAAMREERGPSAPHRLEARQRRAMVQIRGPSGGLPRLCYALNPHMPCDSPRLRDRWIASFQDLPSALDALAIASPNAPLLDQHVAAFIGVRSERFLDQDVKALAFTGDAAVEMVTTIHLLAVLQSRYHPLPLPGLTAWVAARAQPLIERWRNRARRKETEERLKALVPAGFLTPILEVLDDAAGQTEDAEGLHAARAELDVVDIELAGIEESGARRVAVAVRLGQEIAAGVGLAVIATMLVLTALG
jgi:eukaryotic-like serine/threonine-protein kinase